MRSFRFKLFFVMLAAVALLAGATHLLHGYQLRRNARAFLEQADRAEREGRPDLAADYLARYVGFAPGDTDARTRYGRLLEGLASTPRELQQAFLLLEEALRRDPARQDVRRELAKLAMRLERFSDAGEHLAALLATTPNDAELLQLRGRCAEATGRAGDAEKDYRAALTALPQQLDTYLLLARLLREDLHDEAGADAVLDALIKENHDSFRAHLAAAAFCTAHGQADRGVRHVRTAYERAPEEADVLLAVAALPGDRREAGEQRRSLDTGLRLYPQDTRFPLALARAALADAHRDEAREWVRKALDAQLSDPERLWTAADLLLDAGAVAEARDVVARLRQGGFTAPLTDYLEARALVCDGAWRQAARRFEDLRPQMAPSRALAKQVNLFLGRCYEQLGNADLAVAAYRQAVTLDPRWVPARLGLATASLSLGKIDDALDEYRTIRQTVPEARLVIARLAILRNLRLARSDRNWAEAVAAVADAEKALPGSLDVLLLRVELLAGQSHLDEARQLLEQAPEEHRRRPTYWVARAGVVERLGQPERVLPLLDEGERLAGASPDLDLARARYWSTRPGAAAGPALARLEETAAKASGDEQARLRAALAEAHYRLGNRREAERLWNQVAEAAGQQNGLQVRLLLFDLALQDGDRAAMDRLLAQVRAIEGEAGAMYCYGRAAELVRLAHEGDRSGLAEARARLEEAGKQRPNWSRVRLLEASVAELEGNTEEAITRYQAAVRQGERRPEIIRRVVQLLYERQRYVEADELIRKLPEQAPVSGELMKLAAEMSLRSQNTERALEMAQQAVPADSRSWQDQLWLGHILAALGRLPEAEKCLRQATVAGGDCPDPWVALVQFFARTRQPEAAEAALHEAEQRFPREQRPLLLAQCYQSMGKLAEAEEQFGQALKAQPEAGNVIRVAAGFYLSGGAPHKAEPLLRRLLERTVKTRPADVTWARRNLAFTLSLSGDATKAEEALALLDQNRSASGEASDDSRARAVVLALRPQSQSEAIRILENLGRSQPLTGDEQFLLARLYQARGDWLKTRDRLRALVTQHGDNPAYLAFTVRSLLDRNETDEALFWLGKLERVEQDPARLVELRAHALHKQGRTTEALDAVRTYAGKKGARLGLVVALFEELGAQAAADTESAYRRLMKEESGAESALAFARFLARQGRRPEALDLCRQACQSGPPEVVAGGAVGVLRASRAGAAEAEPVERWLLERLGQKSSVPLLLALADLRDYQRRYPEAEASYRQVLVQDDRQVVALNNLAWLLTLDGHDGRAAVELVNRGVDRLGPTGSLLDTRALAYLQAGDTEAALRDLERVVNQKPMAGSYFHLAQVQQQRNNRGAAEKAFRQALALGLKPADLHPLQQPAYDRLRLALGVQ
jgi:tetratricopeptide (TPR) repeat protein